MWQRFDIVRLLRTRNIKFLSGPAGRPADPNGNWSIVGNLPNTAMVVIAKDNTIAVAPLTDIQKVANFDIDRVIAKVKTVKTLKDLEKKNGKEKEDSESSEHESGGYIEESPG